MKIAKNNINLILCGRRKDRLNELEAQLNKLVSVKKIAQLLNVSHNHLSKVLQRLVKSELIISIKGHSGGFKLAKPAEEVTFLEIYEAIEGRFKPSTCLLSKLI